MLVSDCQRRSEARGALKRFTYLMSAAALVLPLGCARTSNPPAASATTPTAGASPAAMSSMPPMPASIADWARGAQLFEGLGSFHRGIATKSPEAQQYFDQGMRLMWAFNHDESTRSFARAFEIDRGCAICLWGVALTVGPNYNQPMMAEPRAKVAFESLKQAKGLALTGSPVERALITALEARYPRPTALDPSNVGPILVAYADAMRVVARQFPDDLDVQTMFAESLMNVNAWKLWTLDGKANPGTDEIISTLESVLARDPRHPGANHYYVHALEASPDAAKAVVAAERLRGMMPAAGHLEHMPAHIMQRVGRYEDAAQANRNGAAADRVYLSKTQPLDYYVMYVAHNFQFLGYSTAMQGRKADTLAVMTELRTVFPESAMIAMPGTDWYGAEPYLAMLRFGLWQQMLAEPRPDPKLKLMTGGYLFARSAALAASNRIEESKSTLAELDGLRAALPSDSTAGLNTAPDVLAVAAMIAKAQIAIAEHRRDAGIAALIEAVAMEDRLAYDEPADWFFPVRHILGAELLKAGRSSEAEAVYREDLRRNPMNGWSLFGLSQALRAEKKTGEAREVEAKFNEAWKRADITLTASAI
jgi:tetratricopeptide (TPR) repeat protein